MKFITILILSFLVYYFSCTNKKTNTPEITVEKTDSTVIEKVLIDFDTLAGKSLAQIEKLFGKGEQYNSPRPSQTNYIANYQPYFYYEWPKEKISITFIKGKASWFMYDDMYSKIKYDKAIETNPNITDFKLLYYYYKFNDIYK